MWALEFHIKGLLRPALGSPGEYGAIDAANATLNKGTPHTINVVEAFIIPHAAQRARRGT